MQQMFLGHGPAGSDDDGIPYIDKVFKSYAYRGNGTTGQTLDVGINFTEDNLSQSLTGGLVWIKRRSGSASHALWDTERGPGTGTNGAGTKAIATDQQFGQGSIGGSIEYLSGFDETGFTLAGQNLSPYNANGDGEEYIAWCFKKSKGFFDCVTYTGNGSAVAVSHGLGCNPAWIMIKRTDDTSDWGFYYYDGSHNEYGGKLNTTDTLTSSSMAFSTSSTSFTAFASSFPADICENGASYVAYVFAGRDDADSHKFGANEDKPVIEAVKFTTDGSGHADVSLGWRPQFSFARSTGSNQWFIGDEIRGLVDERAGQSTLDKHIWPNSGQGDQSYSIGYPTSDGMSYRSLGANTSYIALLIRFADGIVGKPAEAGTDVFTMDTGNGNSDGSAPAFDANFAADFYFARLPAATDSWYTSSRIGGTEWFAINSNSDYSTTTYAVWDFMKGAGQNWTSSYQGWLFKRHAGFDVVNYEGSGSNTTKKHSLGRTPEMIWVKKRATSGSMVCYHKGANGGTNPEQYFLNLRSLDGDDDSSAYWNDTAPTSSVFSIGTGSNVNSSSTHYLAAVFASVSGISKVGYYDGDSNGQTITTGFTPRFMFLKRTNTSDSRWYVLDTTRGWGSGNDQWLGFSLTQAQSGWDFGEPTATGFTLTGGNAHTNADGNKYIYYAHA